MAPPKGTKRRSDEGLLAASPDEGALDNTTTPRATVSSGTPDRQDPQKRQRRGITAAQKQALIDNLQLEISERARKLRAQYNLQAQGLRTRIEIRVNRIPGALRRAKMGDLADKYQNGQHPQSSQARPLTAALPSASRAASRPPPVPEKDTPQARPDAPRTAAAAAAAAAARSPAKASSSHPGPGRSPQKASEGALGRRKNHGGERANLEASPRKKRVESTRTGSVLSPASANIRPMPKHTPSGKSFTKMRPTASAENIRSPLKSPVKQISTPKVLSSLAEKARSARKVTTSGRGGAATPRAAHPALDTTSINQSVITSMPGITTGSLAAGRRRRGSDASESTVSSTSTVTRKTATKASARNGVLGPTKAAAGAGVTKKTAASKAIGASTATGRSLRKRTLISEKH